MEEMLRNEILKIKSSQKVAAIMLVGAAADLTREKKEPEKLNDIDLFVIVEGKGVLEREIREEQDLKWDITFIPCHVLEKGLEEKWPFLICSLVKTQVIHCSSPVVSDLLEKAKLIFAGGPRVLDLEEIQYIRFNLRDKYDDVLCRKEDEIAARFLVYSLLREVLVEYFRLNNMWLPREKKIFPLVQEKDSKLYEMCCILLEEDNIEIILKILFDIIEYVLLPFGGVICSWSKGPFPVK